MKKIASIVLTIIFIFAIYANSVAVKAAQNVIDNTTEGKIVEIKENETKNLEDYQEKYGSKAIWNSSIYFTLNTEYIVYHFVF